MGSYIYIGSHFMPIQYTTLISILVTHNTLNIYLYHCLGINPLTRKGKEKASSMAWSFYVTFHWRNNQHWEQFTLVKKSKCDPNEMLSMLYDSGDWNIHNCTTTWWTMNGPVGLTMDEKSSRIHVTSTIHPLGTVTIV